MHVSVHVPVRMVEGRVEPLQVEQVLRFCERQGAIVGV